jgi:serine O-acetyltransferase
MYNWFVRIKNLTNPITVYVYNEIPFGVLPKSTKLGHNGIGVVINKKAKIGKYCFIGQNVVIGGISDIHVNKIPVIEDHVKIFANACVIGGVVVGHHSQIAAGSTVYKDVPPFSLVTGDCIIRKDFYNNK